MVRFRQNMRQVMQKTGNAKRVKRLVIFVTAFMLMGCSAQGTDLSEKTSQDAAQIYNAKEEVSNQTAELADDNTALTESYAEQIIKEADNAIQAIMKKADIDQTEQPDESGI